jgi:hypothetical protein
VTSDVPHVLDVPLSQQGQSEDGQHLLTDTCSYDGAATVDPGPVPTSTADCPICHAPPPGWLPFGWGGCAHQVAAGLVPNV